MSLGARKAMGCGCGAVVAILTVIGLVVAMFFVFNGSYSQKSSEPLPDNVPPATGAPVPAIDIHAKGRTSVQLNGWAQPLSAKTGISVQALSAYGNAELIAKESWPGCHLSWNTLAGIGYVETRHGTYSRTFLGSKLDENGVATPPIIGVALDGSPGLALVRDTDGGALDGDTEFDRAVGPMQFIPESWRVYGRDADGDGVANPQQIDDAALSAAKLLCDKGGDLSTPRGWTNAIHGYNQSDEYLIKVRNAAAAYALGQSAN